MNFISGFLLFAQKLAGTAKRSAALLAPNGRRARAEKNIVATSEALSVAAYPLERCLPRSFGL